jgi:hypothetical protein
MLPQLEMMGFATSVCTGCIGGAERFGPGLQTVPRERAALPMVGIENTVSVRHACEGRHPLHMKRMSCKLSGFLPPQEWRE